MSNVLIGIIGVILFIGLALAGALFLGPRFQQSSNSSKAAAVSSLMQQTANAVSMYEMDGAKLPSSTTDKVGSVLVASGHLKALPKSPMKYGEITAVNSGGGVDSGPATFLYVNLGTDEVAKQVCLEIERGAGSPNPEVTAAPNPNFGGVVTTYRRLGCFADSYYSPAIYQAYIPL